MGWLLWLNLSRNVHLQRTHSKCRSLHFPTDIHAFFSIEEVTFLALRKVRFSQETGGLSPHLKLQMSKNALLGELWSLWGERLETKPGNLFSTVMGDWTEIKGGCVSSFFNKIHSHDEQRADESSPLFRASFVNTQGPRGALRPLIRAPK